eukprot:jgi/Ulvmu1/10395/UM061_0079.1
MQEYSPKKVRKPFHLPCAVKFGTEQSNEMLLAAKSKSAPLSSMTTHTSGMAFSNTMPAIANALPGHMAHLLAISEAMESVLATKRGGHVKQVLFRADKVAVEASARRTFKVDHVLQLKTLLGDSLELCWVPQALSKRPAGSRTSVKDLDLAIRFRIPDVAPASPETAQNTATTPSPVRGRSVTRRSITSSASTPPTECNLDVATQPSENNDSNSTAPSTPIKAQQSATLPASPSVHRRACHVRLRNTLLQSFAEHVASTNSLLAQLGSLQDMLQHSAWDADTCPVVSQAPLPTRPSTVAEALASSKAATPVRCGTSASMLTPSPSIRGRREYLGGVLPSPQVTPQSLMPPADRPLPSPSPYAASRSPSASAMGRVPPMYTPPAKMLRGAPAGVRATVMPLATLANHAETQQADAAAASPLWDQHHSVPNSRPVTPVKYALAAPQADSEPTTPRRVAGGGPLVCNTPQPSGAPFATPSQTPKRKRAEDGSPSQSMPQTPASSRPPVRVLRTPAGKRTERVAAGTPGRTPRKELVVSGSTASPHVRKAIMAHAKSPKFEGALPIVQMRTPARSTCKTLTKAVLRDVYSKDAHCAAVLATPASTKSAQSHLQQLASPLTSKRAVNFASPVADASSFYSKSGSASRSTSKPRIGCPLKVNESGTMSGIDRQKARKANSQPHPVSDAAILAASIMDDDMAELLQRNARSAIAKRIADDPKNIREGIRKEARKQLPAMYDQLRAEFERRHSLKMPYEECVEMISDMGLTKAGLAKDAAGVYLQVLAAAVPDWLSIKAHDSLKSVCIARMCTGVRRRLEDVAHGYADVQI